MTWLRALLVRLGFLRPRTAKKDDEALERARNSLRVLDMEIEMMRQERQRARSR